MDTEAAGLAASTTIFNLDFIPVNKRPCPCDQKVVGSIPRVDMSDRTLNCTTGAVASAAHHDGHVCSLLPPTAS